MSVSFIIPAYNCRDTVAESVESVLQGNFEDGDELVIVNDCSNDGTDTVLHDLQRKHSVIRVIRHLRNKGGGAARNTAVEHARHAVLFCLDSDNILGPGSIRPLKEFLLRASADVASFQELHYFEGTSKRVTHKWVFRPGVVTLEDYLSGPVVPGASGNYMFTRQSWEKAGGYPEFAGALDTWGFGFRQLVSGSRMMVLEGTHYFHRHGHASYWVRYTGERSVSLTALQVVLPFLDLLDDEDVDYIMSRNGRYTWVEQLRKRPVRVKSSTAGQSGTIQEAPFPLRILRRALRKLGR
jgi:glycosyltransferase involved in cell wall biosynthesis